MRKITRKEREKLIRAGISLLCILCFMLSAFAVHSIAKVLPDSVCTFLASRIMREEYKNAMEGFASQYMRPESYADCVPVSLSAVLGYDYEEEASPAIPEGVAFVSTQDLCGYKDIPMLLLSNRTSYNENLSKLNISLLPFDLNSDKSAPAVLIVHTHGTESYLQDGIAYYTPDNTFRSTNIEENVVAVGKVIADTLNELGINTIHDTAMYDEYSYNDAYTNSRNAIKMWLSKYPTIQCVIDVHRDAIVNGDGVNVKPVVTFENTDCAQLMLVVGTDEGGSGHKNWKTNLTFAAMLQQKANDTVPRLFRPINLRSASFNQQLTEGSLLLEVGSCANTITEAKEAAYRFAKIFASVYK